MFKEAEKEWSLEECSQQPDLWSIMEDQWSCDDLLDKPMWLTYSSVIWSNTNPGVAVKVFCRYDYSP